MNIGIIFAGGVGQRMNTDGTPKQFLELNGKPILIYTIEKFQQHEEIDGIILVCIESWIDYCISLLEKYKLTKVVSVVPGGENGHKSRFIGLLKAAELYDNPIVLIHDGVRPLIDADTITNAIKNVREYGSAVVASPAVETIALDENDEVRIVAREKCRLLRAPQCFYLNDILSLYQRTKEDGFDDFIDSATIMQHYGQSIKIIIGPPENIKITTPLDYYVFKGIMEQ